MHMQVHFISTQMTIDRIGTHFPYNIMETVRFEFDGTQVYSGTLLKGHPSTADTCDITDISECPDHISIDLNT